MNFELTEVQAKKIANNILEANFWMAGLGHFDLTTEEMAQVIRIAFSSSSRKRLPLYYDQLEKQKM